MSIYPRIVDDIEISMLFKDRKREIFCIGSRKIDKYFFVEGSLINDYKLALSYMNGENKLDEISRIISGKVSDRFYIQQLYNLCSRSNLIYNDDNTKSRQEFNEYQSLFKTIISFNMSRLFEQIGKMSNILGYVLFSIITTIIVIGVGMYFVGNEQIPWITVAKDVRVLYYTLIISTFSILIHECAHAIVAIKFGLKPDRLVISAFSYITLVCYIKLPGIYFLESYKRIMVWSAGAFSNLFLSSLSYIIYCNTEGQLKLFFIIAMIINITLVIGSLVPFYISDGYYILATLLKKPNLRKNAFKNFMMFFRGRFNLSALCYITYFISTLIFIIIIIIIRFIPIIIKIYDEFQMGYSFLEIFRRYLNIFSVIILLIISRLIGFIIRLVKRKK